MSTDNKASSKVKNSFIYFQIGLIVSMVIVLIILELKIESKPFQKAVYNLGPGVENFSPTEFNIQRPQSEKVVEKEVQKPVVQKVIDKVVVKPNVEKVDSKVVDASESTTESTNATNTDTTTKTEGETNNETSTANNNLPRNTFSIEEFPEFEACKGVAKSQQKTCFDEQLAKAVFKNLEYPALDASNNKEGVVFLEFVISNTGEITNVSAVPNGRSTELMKKNAIKALKQVPRIKPAKQGTQNVAVKYSLPVTFKIKN